MMSRGGSVGYSLRLYTSTSTYIPSSEQCIQHSQSTIVQFKVWEDLDRQFRSSYIRNGHSGRKSQQSSRIQGVSCPSGFSCQASNLSLNSSSSIGLSPTHMFRRKPNNMPNRSLKRSLKAVAPTLATRERRARRR